MRSLMTLVVVVGARLRWQRAGGRRRKGQAVFESATPKCAGCHTAAKNPLAKAGAENTEAELKAWLRTPKEQMAKESKKGMMPAYSAEKISDADLDALVAYLATMK